VTRYLIDTNIVSEATKPDPSAAVADWLTAQADADLFIAALTLAEIWRGILQTSPGRKRRDLERWFAGEDGPPRLFADRILPFGEPEAIVWARIMADAKAAGRPRSALDMIIAATAITNAAVVATANERDFRGVVDILNPNTPVS
jgi:predicted nucleic acid-binding protein